MIVFPDSFVLSAEAAGAPLRLPRIAWSTYTFDLSAVAVTASTESAGFPRDAPLRPDTAEAWSPSALPATWQVDLGATRDVDYVGIAGATIGSSGAAVAVETSMDAAAWTTLGGSVSPGDDSPLLFLDAVRSARHMRVKLTGGAIMPRVPVIYAGVALVMPRDVKGGGFAPLNLARQTVLNRTLSRGGQFLGQGFRRNGVAGSVGFEYLEPGWYRASFDPFVRHARHLPYFFGWWPEAYPTEVAYVWSERDIAPSYMGVRDLMAVQWSMQGIGNAS